MPEELNLALIIKLKFHLSFLYTIKLIIDTWNTKTGIQKHAKHTYTTTKKNKKRKKKNKKRKKKEHNKKLFLITTTTDISLKRDNYR